MHYDIHHYLKHENYFHKTINTKISIDVLPTSSSLHYITDNK